MRRLEPVPGDWDVRRVYDVERPPPQERPYVLVNMVSSVDGATVVSGVTRSLGSDADRRLFVLLRSLADAILVGAETVRAEGYGPAQLTPELREERIRRGLDAVPRIAVVSRRLDLDWSSRFFTAGPRPIVLAPDGADPASLAAAAEAADVVTTSGTSVDFAVGLQKLRALGVTTLLCEGGPALNAQLLQADLIDELCLTLSPNLVGGGGGRTIMGAATLPDVRRLSLASVMEDGSSLFLRYLLTRSS